MMESHHSFTSLTTLFTPRILTVCLATAMLSACGGSDGDDTASADTGFNTPLVVANAAKVCKGLKGLEIAAKDIGEPSTGAVVTTATYKEAVAAKPNAANTAMIAALPDYCEVMIDVKPVDPTAQMVAVQVNLPASWNGKSVQMGGGGLNGSLVTGLGPARTDGPETELPLMRSFMTLGTDSGHRDKPGVPQAVFALHQEELVNYAYAAYKKTHDVGTAVSKAFYGHRAQQRYYVGGSEGGREGMIMAQRYPHDFEGIVTVDPVIRLIGLWQYQLSMGTQQAKPGAWLGGKTQLIHDTVKSVCDALDGIEDNVVSNYQACKPLAEAALAGKRCASGGDDGLHCFSDAQLETLTWIHNPQFYPFSLANGINSYPGYLFGSEGVSSALDRWVIGSAAPGSDPYASDVNRSYSVGGNLVRYFVTQNPAYNPLDFNTAEHATRLVELSNMMDFTDPDLSVFHQRGGKLILRENLSDKGNSPQTGIDYYDAVVNKMGQSAVDEFFVGYGATGLPHTTTRLEYSPTEKNVPTYGTPGEIDLLGMLDDWVVKGQKPADTLTLTLRERLAPYALMSSKPMCRFGSYPHFVGTTPSGGNLASNYECRPM